MKASGITKETILDLGTAEKNFPEFAVGDRIEVSMIIQDKSKERIQKFEGDVIGMKGQGVAQTFKVRKISESGIGIELTFPYYSPSIDSIKLLRQGVVRRAKLNYLRDKKSSKASKIKGKNDF